MLARSRGNCGGSSLGCKHLCAGWDRRGGACGIRGRCGSTDGRAGAGAGREGKCFFIDMVPVRQPCTANCIVQESVELLRV